MMAALKLKSAPYFCLSRHQMQILFYFLEIMLDTTTCLFCEGISCIPSSASSLSSLPPAHPLALVDWVVFSNVSTFTEFPPPLENKVLLANLVIIYAMFHPVQIVASGSRVFSIGFFSLFILVLFPTL